MRLKKAGIYIYIYLQSGNRHPWSIISLTVDGAAWRGKTSTFLPFSPAAMVNDGEVSLPTLNQFPKNVASHLPHPPGLSKGREICWPHSQILAQKISRGFWQAAAEPEEAWPGELALSTATPRWAERLHLGPTAQLLTCPGESVRWQDPWRRPNHSNDIFGGESWSTQSLPSPWPGHQVGSPAQPRMLLQPDFHL